jgi:hypothetical protein
MAQFIVYKLVTDEIPGYEDSVKSQVRIFKTRAEAQGFVGTLASTVTPHSGCPRLMRTTYIVEEE